MTYSVGNGTYPKHQASHHQWIGVDNPHLVAIGSLQFVSNYWQRRVQDSHIQADKKDRNRHHDEY
ncbi:hypothetical protein D3C84_1169860 [compost metagenome]